MDKTELIRLVRNHIEGNDPFTHEIMVRNLIETIHTNEPTANAVMDRMNPNNLTKREMGQALHDLLEHEEHGKVVEGILTNIHTEVEEMRDMDVAGKEAHVEKKREEFAKKIEKHARDRAVAFDQPLGSIFVSMKEKGLHQHGYDTLEGVGKKIKKDWNPAFKREAHKKII